ncbi:MAG: hypothetical protein D6714_15515 [Bacteroidetes bacterium]|nr:MAG: hypothetical protein D6714_15515 [Bacteroidota bacterium]
MRKNKILILITACLSGLYAPFAQAQTDLPAEQVEVIKNFEATLEETEKIPVEPELPPLDTATQLQQYRIPQTHQLTVEYEPPKIRPLAMRPDPLPEVYDAYLKLGAGIPTTFYGEGIYGKFVDGKYDVGLNLKYHLGNFSNDKIENQKFRTVDVGANGTYYLDQGIAVGGDVQFSSNKVYYYGYNFDDSGLTGIDENDVQQHFNTIDIGAKVFNGVQTVGDINYTAGFKFYNLQDNYAGRENGLKLYLDANKWIAGTHSIDFGLGADFSKYTDTLSQKLNNFYIRPSFTFHGDAFFAKAGVNLVANQNDFTFFPDVEAMVNVTGSELAVFAGAKGDLVKNNYRAISSYNPYVSYRFPALQLRNTKTTEFYGGVKGTVKIIEYEAKISYKSLDSLATYQVDDKPPQPFQRTFKLVYDNGNVISIGGALRASIGKNIDLVGAANYNVYDLDNEIKAWHLPALEINSALIVRFLENKLRVKTQAFIENGVPYKQADGTSANLNGLFDLSFGAEYLISEHFGAFLDINNLLDNERQRWRYYPTYGINVLVGVTARF